MILISASEFRVGDVIVHDSGHEFEVVGVSPSLGGFLVKTIDLVGEIQETHFRSKPHKVRRNGRRAR